MSYPTDKATLLPMIREERARLETTLAKLTVAQMNIPGVEGDWTVKDVLAHLAFWEQRMLTTIRQGAAGEQVAQPQLAPDEWPAYIDRINAENYAATNTLSIEDVLDQFQDSYQAMLQTIESLSDEQLFSPAGISANIGGSAVELIAGDTYAHYRSHANAIREWMTHTLSVTG